MKTVFADGKLIMPSRIVEDGGLVVIDGIITEVFEGQYNRECKCDRLIDAGGRYISPGFIDLHVHGGAGRDFADGTVECMIEAGKVHMQHGTTSMTPTAEMTDMKQLNTVFDSYREVKDICRDGSDFLGLHLEGPYISTEQKGGFSTDFIRKLDRHEYLAILDNAGDIIANWTIAPELDGAMELGDELGKRGIVASIGHSNALYDEVLRAYDHGYTHISHLYSCTSTVRRVNAYRHAGIIEAAYLLDGMDVEIIADGKHLPESLLKLIYKIKGSDHINLVTDAIRAAGMPDNVTTFEDEKVGQRVIIEDGVAKLADRSAFAGSIATSDRLLRTMTRIARVPLIEAVKMMTATPARILGVSNRKGSLSAGKDADIVVFDENIDVGIVMVKGNLFVNRIA